MTQGYLNGDPSWSRSPPGARLAPSRRLDMLDGVSGLDDCESIVCFPGGVADDEGPTALGTRPPVVRDVHPSLHSVWGLCGVATSRRSSCHPGLPTRMNSMLHGASSPASSSPALLRHPPRDRRVDAA